MCMCVEAVEKTLLDMAKENEARLDEFFRLRNEALDAIEAIVDYVYDRNFGAEPGHITDADVSRARLFTRRLKVSAFLTGERKES